MELLQDAFLAVLNMSITASFVILAFLFIRIVLRCPAVCRKRNPSTSCVMSSAIFGGWIIW